MIYFIEAQAEGRPIKIGYSGRSVDMRRAVLQMQTPFELVVLKMIDGDRPLEKYIHNLLADNRIRGEWFSPSDALFRLMADNGDASVRDEERRSRKDQYNLRISMELRDELHRIAFREGRTPNMQAEHFIHRAIKNYRRKAARRVS